MPPIAAAIADRLLNRRRTDELRAEVAAIRRRHTGTRSFAT
jgi:hypothetical protein